MGHTAALSPSDFRLYTPGVSLVFFLLVNDNKLNIVL